MDFDIENFIAYIAAHYSHIISPDALQKTKHDKIFERIINYYADIISCMPGNVYWLDQEGVAVGCNQNVLDMFNFKTLAEFKGLSFEEMGRKGNWSAEATASFKRDTLSVIAAKKPVFNIEEPPIPHADGRTIYFLTSRVPLFNTEGEVIGVVGISIDITERKMMEDALLAAKAQAEEANKVKLDFIHNMEHDIRTPFNGIYGIAKMLASQEVDPEKKSLLQDIVSCSKELLEYSTEILDFSRIESGTLPVLAKKFDLKQMLDGVAAMETPPAKNKNLKFSIECADDVPTIVIGDKYRLQRVLINLISNAIKFTSQGSVTLQVRLGKKISLRQVALIFTVKDTGIGIPIEKQNLLYERFSRLAPANKGQYTGHGLGLRIVKQFVGEMDGDIEIDSSIGEGTTFACTLPFTIPLIDSVTTKNDCTNTHYNAEGAKVLVVEDHLVSRKVVCSLLKELGCEMDTAQNAKEAIEFLLKNTYDIILLDIGLPDMNGFDLAKQIREKELGGPSVPIIAISAHTELSYQQKCFESGMDDYCPKPLTLETASNILAKWNNNLTHMPVKKASCVATK